MIEDGKVSQKKSLHWKWIRYRDGIWIPHRKRTYLYWFKFLQEAQRSPDFKVNWNKYRGWGGANEVMGGGTLLGKSFKDLFNEQKVHYPKVSNESLPRYIEWSINRIGNYPYTFFVDERGNPKVDTITPQDFEDYFIYRKNNSVKKGVPYAPSNNTIRKECTLLGQMFSYAFEKGHLPKELKVKRPSPEKDSRRPSFTKEEWLTITTGMRKRVKEGWGAHKRDRFILI